MLLRTQPVLSRLSSFSSPPGLSASLLSRCFHSHRPVSYSSLHSRSSQPRDGSSPRPVHALEQDVNGWFLDEVPGYKGDALPGGASRFQCRVYAVCYTVAIATFAWAVSSAPNTDPAHWAKEYVLNVEKFKAPDKALPFQHQQHDAEEEGQH